MEYVINKENVGKRFDIYVCDVNDKITRSYIKRLIEEEQILVNNVAQKSGYKLKLNDVVLLKNIEDKMTEIQPEKIKLEIVYEDNDVIIINKEKGMVVHPANGNYTGTMVNSLIESHADELSSINGVIRPGIVHRIDKDTSGILVVAKNDNAHKKLSEQFKVHSITRKYVALVKGIVKEDEFTINLPIGRNEKDRKKMAVTNKNSKEAITHIKVISRFYNSNITYVEASLETGRTHQIRVHMAYIHYPLLGDEVYSKKNSKFKIKGQALHAKTLGFIHPTTNKYIEFNSEPTKEFLQILDTLEKKEK